MHKPVEHFSIKPRQSPEDTYNEPNLTEISFPIESETPISPAKMMQLPENNFLGSSKRQSEENTEIIKSSSPSGSNNISDQAFGLNSQLSKMLSRKQENRSTGVTTMATIMMDKKGYSKLVVQANTVQCKLCKNTDIMKIVHNNLYNKYEKTTQNTYNTNVVNDIIINANTHVTAVFKDYLIYDDFTEELKLFYPQSASYPKLTEIIQYFDKSSKVFPNYVILEERKYLFKNIERKQKAINQKCEAIQKDAKNNKQFNQKLKKAQDKKGLLEEMVKKAPRINPNVIAKMNIADIVDKFIDRDSLSLINQSNCTNIELPFKMVAGSPQKETLKNSIVPPNAKIPLKENAEKIASKHNKKPTGLINPSIQHDKKVITKPTIALNTKHKGITRQDAQMRHKSQEPLTKKIPEVQLLKGNINNGRMSAAGHYKTFHTRNDSNNSKKNSKNSSKNENKLPKKSNLDLSDEPEPKAHAVLVKNVARVNVNLNINNSATQPALRSITPHLFATMNPTPTDKIPVNSNKNVPKPNHGTHGGSQGGANIALNTARPASSCKGQKIAIPTKYEETKARPDSRPKVTNIIASGGLKSAMNAGIRLKQPISRLPAGTRSYNTNAIKKMPIKQPQVQVQSIRPPIPGLTRILSPQPTAFMPKNAFGISKVTPRLTQTRKNTPVGEMVQSAKFRPASALAINSTKGIKKIQCNNYNSNK